MQYNWRGPIWSYNNFKFSLYYNRIFIQPLKLWKKVATGTVWTQKDSVITQKHDPGTYLLWGTSVIRMAGPCESRLCRTLKVCWILWWRSRHLFNTPLNFWLQTFKFVYDLHQPLMIPHPEWLGLHYPHFQHLLKCLSGLISHIQLSSPN